MTWEPYMSPNKGETIAFTLALTKQVRAYAVFYSPDGRWYSSVIVGTRRIANYEKASSEEDAKARAVAQARAFQEELRAALYNLAAITRPRIVCLCGSTRFWRTFQEASLKETLAGNIVLSIGAASGTDDYHFGNLPQAEYDRVKTELDELHLRKIELADEVLVLNVGGYTGESTRREIAHAQRLGKPIRWWELVEGVAS